MSNRLTVDEFRDSDAHALYELANDVQVADGTLNLPHPYSLAMAHAWVRAPNVPNERIKRAVRLVEQQVLVGNIGLAARSDGELELGYWIGRQFWGHGYATEAVLLFLSEVTKSVCSPDTTIVAYAFADNLASRRVLLKAGMTESDRLSAFVKKNGVARDVYRYTLER
jgi:ribosomal-protein-alanine N-acetyltransferase